MRRVPLLSVLASAAVLGACESGTEPALSGLTEAEAAELADALAFEAYNSVAGQGDAAPVSAYEGSAEPVTFTFEFTRTVQCPVDGTITVVGSATGERDRETRSISVQHHAEKTYDACGWTIQAGVLTVDGALTLDASMSRVQGQPMGLQSMSMTGAFAWSTDDGRSGTCEVDMSASFDPGTHTRTTTGDFCGRDVSIRRAWHFGP